MVDEFGAELSVIGKEGNLEYWIEHLVTGQLDYAADHPKVGMLYTRVLCATLAHAQITSIDTSQAEALEGVEAVITYEEHPLWSDAVVYWGQPVAAVAAVDEATAARALELIDVVYDERPAVIDPEEAMKDEVLVGIWPDTNVKIASETDRGDIAAGFAAADVTIEGTTGWTNYFQHNLIEPDSAIAWWIGEDVYMWYKTQNPYAGRNSAAGALGIPQSKCHLYHHASGAGYGSAGGSNNHVTAAVLSRKLGGRPVQYHQSRFETMLHNVHQFANKLQYRIGAKNDGTLTALDFNYWGDCGVSSWAPASQCSRDLQATFKCPNGHFSNWRVLTNKSGCGYWRCVADPPGQFPMNIAFDRMAEELGMNPLEFRMKNLVTPDMAHQDSGRPLSANAMAEAFQSSADMIGYNQKWHAPGTKTRTDGRMHGIGIAGHLDGHGGISGRRAGTIQLNRDGTCYFNDGIARNHPTYCAHGHIIAQTLGINYEDVMIGALGDIDACSDGGMQAGSTCTISQGAAFMVAAIDAREQVFERARVMLEVGPDEPLDADGGVIWVVADPTNSTTHAEVFGSTSQPVIGRGVRWAQELRRPLYDWPVGTACNQFVATCSAAEVAVDTETGEVEILKFVSTDDCGRIIYRNAAFAQLYGGMEIQIGELFLYEQIVDPLTGASLNLGFLGHKYPTSLDIHQDRHEATFIESIDACGPYGLKGCGEPVVSPYGSINSAIYNAIGVWITEAPIYPQVILKALGKA